MGSVSSMLKENNIHISLLYERDSSQSASNDMLSDSEKSDVQSVVTKLDFWDPFTRNQLDAVDELDDYYRFLLIRKISRMRTLFWLAEKQKEFDDNTSQRLKDITDSAVRICRHSQKFALEYLRRSLEDVFSWRQTDCELKYVSLDFIIESKVGKSKTDSDSSLYECICQRCPHLIIKRYHDLGKIFSLHRELFYALFASYHVTVHSLWLPAVLDIWKHSYHKDPGYRQLIDQYADEICRDAEPLCKGLSKDNADVRETALRPLSSFLSAVKHPRAGEFAEYVKIAEKLKKDEVARKIAQAKAMFPDRVNKYWPTSGSPRSNLLVLTYYGECVSSLSFHRKSSCRKCCTCLSADEKLPYGYLRHLAFQEAFRTKIFLEMLCNPAQLNCYSSLVRSTVHFISGKLSKTGGGLENDTDLLLCMLDSVSREMNASGLKLEISCYRSSMFLCSLSEKLLRLLYRHLQADKEYVPGDMTFEQLLNRNKKVLSETLGRTWVLSLEYFMIGMPVIKTGRNYRNRLAHWAPGMTQEDMTQVLTARLMWLFTDVLNSVALYLDKKEGGWSDAFR